MCMIVVKRFSHVLLAALICLGWPQSCDELSESRWDVSRPEEQGLNSARLALLERNIESGQYGEIHSLLIVRHGYLCYEKYFRGAGQNDKHRMYSVTKSVTSALIGIALVEGRISSLDQSLLSFFPEYPTLANMDERKTRIKLRDVLAMRAGFEWDEGSAPYGDLQNPATQMAVSEDWIKFVLDRPMVHEPGTSFRYNSGLSVLLSGVLRKTTGQSAESYANTRLLGPLGVFDYAWETGPHNLTNTGWGMHLRPRDMAKFGEMILRRGTWASDAILPESWVDSCLTPQVLLTYPYGYSYQWWLMALDSLYRPAQRNDAMIAWGYCDQFIFVIPVLDMVVVSTANNPSDNTDDQAIVFLQEHILPAVVDRPRQ